MTNNNGLSPAHQARLEKWRADMQGKTGKETLSTRRSQSTDDSRTTQQKEADLWQQELDAHEKRYPGSTTR